MTSQFEKEGVMEARKVKRSNADESLDGLDNYEADSESQSGRFVYDDENENPAQLHSKNKISKRHHVEVSSPGDYESK